MISAAKIPMVATDALHQRHYALWAREYDESPNPLLSLEERSLTPLLLNLVGADVVDVGCGTGRWLSRLAELGAGGLTGIDLSPEMLDLARQKLGPRARLAVGHATKLPIADGSADVVLASFVASYVTDFTAFASELRRIVREDGRIYICDVHPGTELSCHWKRAFRAGEQQVRLATHSRTLPHIISRLRSEGLRVTTLLEPAFGDPELDTFRDAGKLDSYDAAAGLPAIYILELRASRDSVVSVAGDTSLLLLQRARISLAADTAIVSDIKVLQGRIEAIRAVEATPDGDSSPADAIDLRGHLLLPGLINAHDHLEFGLYPNLGHPPYQNFVEWAADIHEREKPFIAACKAIPRDVHMWWGAIRNLLCGVTTVCHHNPMHPELLDDEFPLKVVKEYEWAHSLTIDSQLHEKRRSDAMPFVLHAAEGIDQTAEREIYALDELGVLDERTVVVHGLGLDARGIALLNGCSTSLAWCPSSNQFLFGRTHSQEAIRSIDRVVLGSDSPLTATGDFLDEVRLACHQVGIPADQVYRMACERSSDTFRLKDGEGRIRAGGVADLVAIRDHGLSPAEALANLTFADIQLVVVRGRVQVASDRIFRRLPAALAEGLKPLQVESELRWIRAPLGRLFREAERVLGCDLRVGGKKVRHVCSAWL